MATNDKTANGENGTNGIAAQTQDDREECLLNYGANFLKKTIVSAENIYVYAEDGQRIIDWTSGQMSCLIGHGHPEVVETIVQHAKHLDHLFSGFLSPPVIGLAQELTKLTPPGLDKAMFLSTGGESNEAAIKLAKAVTGRWEIVGMSSSWHGMTGAAAGAQYHSGRNNQGPLVPGNMVFPCPNAYRSVFRHPDGTFDWETEMDFGWSMIDRASTGALCAFIMEPILSSGGMITLPPGYLKKLLTNIKARNMLLILDEAQTGIGRTGDMFAFEHEGVVPDILTLSKTLGNGLPLSALVTSNDIAQRAKDNGFLFYTTHVNDPLPCAVGLKVLQIVQRDGLVERSRRLGVKLQAELREMQKRHECIGDVRGRGLMAAVEIVADRKTKEVDIEYGNRLADKMMELGISANLLATKSFGGIFRIAPPIICTEEQLMEGLRIMDDAFKAVEEEAKAVDKRY